MTEVAVLQRRKRHLQELCEAYQVTLTHDADFVTPFCVALTEKVLVRLSFQDCHQTSQARKGSRQQRHHCLVCNVPRILQAIAYRTNYST